MNNQKDNLKNKKHAKKSSSRLIVRNLSYKVTEDDIREYFGKYGNIIDLQLLKRPDGKLVGCAFIQYDAAKDAVAAMLKCSNTKFLNREIYVDWAIGKDKYLKISEENKLKTIKSNLDENGVKNKIDKINELKFEMKEDDDGSESDEEDNESESDKDTDKFDDDDEEEDDKKFNKNEKKHLSNDAIDGRTVFLKNVPFDATNEDIKELCKKYGDILYTLINIDPISGHSKGTAFIRFKTKESADLLLKNNSKDNELLLMDSIIEPYPALSRNEIKQKIDLSKQHTKHGNEEDSRNLYLAKEGLIMSGSKAAEGVSASDMAKRHKLEKIKTQILKDLNRFVSRNRLSIHNLPLNYDDDKLKQMIIKHTKLKPHECRVMRENHPSINYPNGKPKGFGFMSFNTHQDALFALRKLNNNPNVFGQNNRPIVAFSIEDRNVHNIKQKRLLKSKQNNPTYLNKLNKNKKIITNNIKMIKKIEKKSLLNEYNNNKNDHNAEDNHKNNNNNKEIENYMGMPAKRGEFIRMRSNKKIREQSKEHSKKIIKLKRLEKRKKDRLMHIKEKINNINSMRMIKKSKKLNNNNENDKFSDLVGKYKNLIDSKATATDKLNISKRKKSKWYVD